MRFMTVLAVHDRGIDEEMGLAERTLLGIMALNAQGLNLLGQ